MRRSLRHRSCIALALLDAACATLTVPLSPQARIDATAAGGTIELTEGTWSEDIVITRPVTLRGAGRESSFITGHRAIVVRSSGVVLENVTIRGSEGGLIVEGAGNLILRHVRLASAGAALSLAAGSAVH